MKPIAVALLSLLLLAVRAPAADAKPNSAFLGEARVYKKIEGRDLRLFIVKPADWQATDQRPALVLFHGGGWTIGDLDTHDVLCRELANGSGCAVFAIDYRMGPEHRFPAAVDDAIAAVGHVARPESGYRIDRSRIAVGGDSAGGNLAAVVALAARDAGGPPLAWQLLIYPVTDLHMRHPSYERNGSGYLLTREQMHYFRDQ